LLSWVDFDLAVVGEAAALVAEVIGEFAKIDPGT
jgi:hypothetical protein